MKELEERSSGLGCEDEGQAGCEQRHSGPRGTDQGQWGQGKEQFGCWENLPSVTAGRGIGLVLQEAKGEAPSASLSSAWLLSLLGIPVAVCLHCCPLGSSEKRGGCRGHLGVGKFILTPTFKMSSVFALYTLCVVGA